MNQDLIQWMLDSDEPWTRYRVLVDLLGHPEGDPDVQMARLAMLAHPQVRDLVLRTSSWPGRPLVRHNDASHPLVALTILADFGLGAADRSFDRTLERILAHHAPEGAFQTQLQLTRAFGGDERIVWGWMACDAPVLLYVLLAAGLGANPQVRQAVEHVASLAHDNGWRCACSPGLGRFRGPGRIGDPCPIANVYALKALSLVPLRLDSPATRLGVEMLLEHWAERGHGRYYLFGVGSDYRRLKYPYVWYDLLHVAEAISRFPFAAADPRLREMVAFISRQADADGRFAAGSVHPGWADWSFGERSRPSPWLTFLALRIQKRLAAISDPAAQAIGL
jgi:hypothetical protein